MTDQLTPEAVKAALKCASVAHLAPALAREYLRLKEVEKAARAATDTGEFTDFALELKRNNRIQDGTRIGYKPVMTKALRARSEQEGE